MVSSDASGLSFTVNISPDLSGLRKQHLSDSAVSYFLTLPVVVPSGGSAKLVSAEGLNSASLPADISGQVGRLGLTPLVTVSNPFEVRGRTLVSVRINPVSGNAIFTQVALRLAFDGGSAAAGVTAEPDPIFNQIFGSAAANFEEASSWPTGPRYQPAAAGSTAENPFGQSNSWVKIAVNQTGLHRLTGADLEAAGVSITGAGSNSIRMFNGGGRPLPFSNSIPRPTLQEISILVLDGGDDRFDRNDTIVWFGEAPNRWIDKNGKDSGFVNNVYTDRNIYWLTASGSFGSPAQRMATTDGSPGSAIDTISTFLRSVHVEQDNLLAEGDAGRINDYYTWYWTQNSSVSFMIPTPGAIAGDSARIMATGYTGTGQSIGRFMSVQVNGSPAQYRGFTASSCSFVTTSLVDGSSNFTVNLNPVFAGIQPYFNYCEVKYRCRNATSGDKLYLALDSLARPALISVTENASASPLLLDLTDPLHPVQVIGYTRSSGTLAFEADPGPSGWRRFYYGTISSAASPLSVQSEQVDDLRAPASQTDLIIVAPREFVSSLDGYAAMARQSGYSVSVAALEDIIDNFGFGLYDPTAIRDFLKFAYETYPSPRPSAALLVGDANYDYLDHLKTGVRNYVPSYINPVEGSQYASTYGDDNYVYFGKYGVLDSDTSYDTSSASPDRGYDMMIARWPAQSSGDIETVTNKVKSYRSSNDFGLWRSRITLVADDEFADFGPSSAELQHVKYTEELEKKHVPLFLNRQKIYLWEYPFVNHEKPAVNDAIVDAFNEGTLIVNYVGHGNPDVWAHEFVLKRSVDLPRMHNADRLPLVYAASCSIGFFDDPQRQAMGEDFLNMPDGGAIGVIAAMRLVFGDDNAALNQQVYDKLMNNGDLTIGQALYAAKLTRQYGGRSVPDSGYSNDRAFVYFGDPLLKLGMPRLRPPVTKFTDYPRTIQALKTHHVEGVVTDQTGNPLKKDGKLLINVYDSDRQKSYTPASGGAPIQYRVAGPSIFRGAATITDGNFAFEFTAPLDIGFGGQGVKICAYAMLDTIDAVFLADSVTVSDTVPSDIADKLGPEIQFAVGGRRNFVDGDIAQVGDTLNLTLSDSSGINLAGGMGHGIELEVDGQAENSVNLTNLFEYQTDSHIAGSLSYPLSGLPTGVHHFKVKAWDNANNVSFAEFSVDLQSGGATTISDLLNYPNPMQAKTTFYFGLNHSVSTLSLEIFTLSGRKIWTVNGRHLKADNYPNGDFSAVWDGRDAGGSRVATGVYIYKATAIPRDGGSPSESYGKVVVVN